jgi:hypothetical protein
MRLLLAAVLGTAVLSLPAAAQTVPEVKKEKKVCKRQDGMELGSHLRARTVRICKTKSEWKEADKENDQNLDVIRDKQNVTLHGNPSPASGPSPSPPN